MKILFVVEHFPSFSETFVLNQVTGLLDLGHDVRIYAVGKPSGIVRHPDIEKYDLHKRTWKGQNIPASKRSRLLGALRNKLAIFKK
jgi:colanic acid/amylovoran biosynthesis glycosyltransferase